MAVNSSSCASSSSHRLPLNMHCFVTAPMSFVFVAFSVTNVVVFLPLCVFVLHRGRQQMKRRRRSASSSSPSSSSAAASLSHSDVLLYHMVAVETLRVLGCVLCCGGVLAAETDVLYAGTLLLFLTWYGQLFFHLLTCVERHLAVVHPVTYRNLRGRRGVAIRNAGVGGAWLLSAGKTGLLRAEQVAFVLDLGLFVLTAALVAFCSVSALRVLTRPGPGRRGGAGGGAGERVDQSKRRASCTIAAIMAALLLRFTGNVAWAVLQVFGGRGYCLLVMCEIWFNLSNSLVPPALFLYRQRKADAH